MAAAPMLPDPCDTPLGRLTPGCQVKDNVEGAADKVGAVIEFGKDPFGYVAQKEAEAAKALTENLIPALARVTQPDLSAEWFINAYKISFAGAVIVWVLILLYDLTTFRRRGESGAEVVDSAVRWSPVFLVGSMFGPAAGASIVKLIGSLNASLINWGIASTDKELVQSFNAIIGDDPSKFLGGSFVAMLVYFCLVLALLLVLVVLIIMLVTLYISGVVLPLSLMWATKVGQREKGRKVLMVWAGILCSQPLIFLLLGFAFSGIAAQAMEVLSDTPSTGGLPPLETLVQLVVVIIMLMMATLGPTTLANFAPVGPTDGAPAGPGVNARKAGQSKGARGGAGPSSPTSSQTSQIAAKQASSQAAGSGASSTAATAAGGAATGGTLIAAKAAHETGKGLAEHAQQMREQAQDTAQQGGAQGGDGGRDGGGQQSGAPSLQSSGSGARSGGDEGTVQGGGLSAAGAGGPSGSGHDASGGGSDGSSGGRGLKSIAGAAGQMAAKAGALAQQAGDHAEQQMDHHREEGRRR